MKLIHNIFDSQRKRFEPGGPLERWYPFFEAMENVFFGTAEVTHAAPHPRDSLSVQRYMMMVILAVLPCLFFGMYNVGLQAFQAAGRPLETWPMFWFGVQTVMPLVLISYIFGFGWEIVFSAIRKHPISEGVFVTCILFPLPPSLSPFCLSSLAVSINVLAT